MNDSGHPRPEVGQEINIVFLGRPELSLMSGRVMFEKGRGLIVESSERMDGSVKRGQGVLVVYAAGDAVYNFKARLAETLSDVRMYLLPSTPPREMEKREYIRATLTMPAALITSGPDEDEMPALDDVELELSASGFRWFGGMGADEGSKVWLYLGLSKEGEETVVLPARIVRVSPGSRGIEMAGSFLDMGQSERDALLRVVFRTRLSELGLQDVADF